jgi:hypothetical protein
MSPFYISETGRCQKFENSALIKYDEGNKPEKATLDWRSE